MSLRPSILATLVGLAALGGGWVPSWADPSAAEWTARAKAPEATQEEQERALSALAALAAGAPSESETREAVFSLAALRLEAAEAGRVGESAESVSAALTFYPEDPRTGDLLRRLALAQVDQRDAYGAHLSFRKWLDLAPQDVDDVLLARAAANAAAVKDMATAFAWSGRVNPQALATPQSVWLHLARLESGLALNRHDVALQAARSLIEHHAEALRLDPQALLACAETFESVGLLEESAHHYEVFVNVHPRSAEHDRALLALGRLLARMGQAAAAERTWHWLIETHAGTGAALDARLALLGLDGDPADPSKIDAYLTALAEAGDLAQARRICDHFGELFIGAGLPLEVVAALAATARKDDGGIAPFAARLCLNDALGPVLDLLASRGDDIGVVLAATQAEALDLPVPASSREILDGARRRLGLPRLALGPLEEALERARQHVREQKWNEIVEPLGAALLTARQAHPVSAGQATRLLAEALWRSGREEVALGALGPALETEAGSDVLRRLRVLRADILFGAGRREQACAEYGAAAALAETRWVRAQLERCAAPQPIGVDS